MSKGTIKRKILKGVGKKVFLKKDRPYYHLKSKSVEAIKEFDDQKKDVYRQDLVKKEGTLAKEARIREYFIKTGLDYKGQAQTAFHKRGVGLKGYASFDFGTLMALAGIPPFVEFEPGADLEGRAGYYQFIILQYQVDKSLRGRNPYPVCLANMGGALLGCTFHVGLGAGLKVPDFELGIDFLEKIQFGYEVKLGGEVNASINGDFYIAFDRHPYWIVRQNRAEVQKLLLNVLKGKNVKKIKKIQWGDDDQKVSKSYGSVSTDTQYCRLLFSTCKPEAGGGLEFKAGIKAGVGKLSGGVKGPEIKGEMKFEWYRMDIPCYNGSVMSQDTQATYKQLTGQAGVALDLSLELGLGLGWKHQEGTEEKHKFDEVGSELESSGLLSWVQLICPEKYLSQADKLQKNISDGVETRFVKLVGEGNAKKARETVGKIKELADLVKGEFTFNSLEYDSCVLVWKPGGNNGTFKMLQGSGYVRGVSVGAVSLASYYLNEIFVKQSKKEMGAFGKKVKKAREQAKSFIKDLAGKLQIEQKYLRGFLMDPSQAGLIQDLVRAGFKAFLFEATFGMKPIKDIQAEKKSKEFSKFVSKFKKTGAPGIFPAYKGMFRKELKGYGSNRANPNLQSLRLRFRLNDHAESDASFKLGINFLGGAKGGIELRGFDRVGSEGIIDLATQWYGEFSSYNTTESAAAYQSPKSVVPAVLM